MLKLKYDVTNNQVNYTLATTTQSEADTVKTLCHNIRVENPMLTYDKQSLFKIHDLFDRKLVSATLSDLFEKFFVDENDKSISNIGAIELLEKTINAYLDVSIKISGIENDVLPKLVRLEPYVRVDDDNDLNFSTKANDSIGQKVSLRTMYDFSNIMENDETSDEIKAFVNYITHGKYKIKLCDIMMFLMEIAWKQYLSE